MKAADVMVKDVITVKPDSSVDDAIKLLVEHDFSALAGGGRDRSAGRCHQ